MHGARPSYRQQSPRSTLIKGQPNPMFDAAVSKIIIHAKAARRTSPS
jgi:hypothetical protein